MTNPFLGGCIARELPDLRAVHFFKAIIPSLPIYFLPPAKIIAEGSAHSAPAEVLVKLVGVATNVGSPVMT